MQNKPDFIKANQLRRSALDAGARAYHDTQWAQCMLAEAGHIRNGSPTLAQRKAKA
jgi:hypothetical protein